MIHCNPHLTSLNLHWRHTPFTTEFKKRLLITGGHLLLSKLSYCSLCLFLAKAKRRVQFFGGCVDCRIGCCINRSLLHLLLHASHSSSYVTTTTTSVYVCLCVRINVKHQRKLSKRTIVVNVQMLQSRHCGSESKR